MRAARPPEPCGMVFSGTPPLVLRMRRAFVLASILATMLAGCALPDPAPGAAESPCGPVVRAAAPFGEEGPNLTVVVYKRGVENVTLCIQLNENDPFVHRMEDPPGAFIAPNVKTVAQGRFTERALDVTVWIAAEEGAKVRASFPLTDDNHVEIEFGGEPRLQVRKFDERREYD